MGDQRRRALLHSDGTWEWQETDGLPYDLGGEEIATFIPEGLHRSLLEKAEAELARERERAESARDVIVQIEKQRDEALARVAEQSEQLESSERVRHEYLDRATQAEAALAEARRALDERRPDDAVESKPE